MTRSERTRKKGVTAYAQYRGCASLLAISYALLLLSGCGFHLRGVGESRQLPELFSSLRVRQVNVEGLALRREMERALKTQARVQVVAEEDGSAPVLTLYDERSDTRAVSVDRDVRVSEFLLSYQVGFDVRDASGKELVKRQEIVLRRTFNFDKNAVLAMEREVVEIRDRMREDAVQQIIRRLAAART